MRASNLPSTPQTPSPAPRQNGQITQSRQLGKHIPFGAYPTPQSSLDVTSPSASRSITPSFSAATSISSNIDIDSNESLREKDSEGETNEFIRIHDQLAKLFPNEKHVGIPRICALGGQSAGKSSLFSMVSNTPLYCANGRATCCPHLIRLRGQGLTLKVDISIQVTNARTEGTSIIPFVQNLTDMDRVAKLLPLASDEARRADGGMSLVRPWTQLENMGESERTSGRDGWANFTSNVVIINIQGPNLRDFDIEDLPGKGSGYAMIFRLLLSLGSTIGLHGDPLVEKLVSDRISQQQNLIVLCLAGVGQEPSTDDRGIQLAMKYDPIGERTIGVITRADQIDVVPGDLSPFVNYFYGQEDDLGGFKPQWGWWPLRLRSPEERRHGVSLMEVRNREKAMFAKEDWMGIQEKAGRSFGIGELEKKLEEVFSLKVQDNIVHLKTTLRESLRIHSKWLSDNPAIQDPVASLHDDVIYRFHNLLKVKVARSNASGRLVDLQENFERIVRTAVPEFLPFTKEEAEANITYQSYCKVDGIVVEEEDVVYIDTLAEMIKSFSSRREPGVIDTSSITQSFVDKYTARWRKLAIEHIDQLWKEVEDVQQMVIHEICGHNVPMAEEIFLRLEDLVTSLKNDSVSFMDQMFRIVTSPLSHSGRGYAQGYETALKQATDMYSKFLESSSSVGHRRRSSSSSSVLSQTNSDIPSITSEVLPKSRRDQCTALQAKITVLMMSRALEFSSSVGEHAQECVMEYLERVTPTLRKKMGLDQVVENVRKRAGDLFESDREKKRERAKIVKEMKTLNEIQQHLDKIVDA
ncbi:hypothetical protein I203_102123 [Kwoniella mangroviensis CBS 8507]|uniref:uncharacterized protein n=1 Tax=Kwoniella mangroviensis CBS 8507 TaxID=1296122 RepID=UPI00080D5CA7|nr:uncharacterized protein I203_03318 [Kwoniella mangroviensis CBS 8507]OCF67621.1 hypothetical protein I203_03318 [Kwoniella mangroviensis CBS 8507]